MKTCTKCGESKPLTDYYKRKSVTPYASRCKVCIRAERKAYAEDRREQMADKTRRWREENPEWAKANNTRYYEANREKLKAAASEYNRNHPELRLSIQRAYRARKRSAAIGTIHWDLLKLRMDCYLCGDPLDGVINMDHIVPLSRGGAHSHDNILPTHQRCNLRKHDSHLSELPWYDGRKDLGAASRALCP